MQNQRVRGRASKAAALTAGIIMLLTSLTSALNDVNITFDSGNDICLTADFLSETCNLTQVITLDGTDDHFLYFAPKTYISENMSVRAKMEAIILNPLLMLSGFGALLILIGSGYLFTRFVAVLGGRR